MAARLVVIGEMPDRRDQHHEGCNPNHPRAIAIMRSRNHPAHKGVAEQGQCNGRSEQREIVEPGSMLASQGSAVVRIRTRLTAISRNGRAMPNTRRVSCRIQSVASA